jgi:transcriptional regulator with XRE-family HTH domain
MAQSKRERLEQAGAWLRQQRQAARFTSARSFAEALGVDPSRISRYETGADAVPDEVAEKIATVLRRDIIEVRGGLALWVPPSSAPRKVVTLADFTDRELMAELERRMAASRPAPETGRRTA